VNADASIEEAAVELGISPTEVIRLLESGQLPSHLGTDGRRRRILLSDLASHREARFNQRQQRVQELRARRWAAHELEPETDSDALTVDS
jgi:excisionase family DNA binding protein